MKYRNKKRIYETPSLDVTKFDVETKILDDVFWGNIDDKEETSFRDDRWNGDIVEGVSEVESDTSRAWRG